MRCFGHVVCIGYEILSRDRMMHADDTRHAQEHPDGAHEQDSRLGVVARVRAAASDLSERLRKALGHDDDPRPPGFNGAMLVA